ncbi:hypothetical protein [Pantoea piersonii]|uniref:hypothetical protein n=1 Tax=Pantoea piersonii TaxID=2364647 RepID=UPI0028A8214E|nr:hypothetical protein [Pantoea piersonii]
MLNVCADLKERKNQRISLFELIEKIREQDPNASYSDIAEWLIIKIADNPEAPPFGFFTLGGGISPEIHGWGNNQAALRQMLVDLYRKGNYPCDPDEVPF